MAMHYCKGFLSFGRHFCGSEETGFATISKFTIIFHQTMLQPQHRTEHLVSSRPPQSQHSDSLEWNHSVHNTTSRTIIPLILEKWQVTDQEMRKNLMTIYGVVNYSMKYGGEVEWQDSKKLFLRQHLSPCNQDTPVECSSCNKRLHFVQENYVYMTLDWQNSTDVCEGKMKNLPITI